MKWAYGVTTVPQRFSDLLPRTLKSLAESGFPEPRLFVDGAGGYSPNLSIVGTLYPCSSRIPTIRTHGNWFLGAYELAIREPNADRYAMFQDDIVVVKNLRAYLERCLYPYKGYLNLITYPSNEKPIKGWQPSNQMGRGAQALVFDSKALRTLLTSEYMGERPKDCHRGHKSIDGGIVTAMKLAGYEEYVHNPSLVLHTGLASSMGNKVQPEAKTFPGEDFDALKFLPCIN